MILRGIAQKVKNAVRNEQIFVDKRSFAPVKVGAKCFNQHLGN
jgi:hypothetical protein